MSLEISQLLWNFSYRILIHVQRHSLLTLITTQATKKCQTFLCYGHDFSSLFRVLPRTFHTIIGPVLSPMFGTVVIVPVFLEHAIVLFILYLGLGFKGFSPSMLRKTILHLI